MRKLYLFAGTNGVGKSTLYLDGVGPSIENSVRINADEIAREKGWDWRDPKTNAKALLLETKKLQKVLKNDPLKDVSAVEQADKQVYQHGKRKY